ncbi:endonuclease V [Chamaesiphon sp. VAR_69_metabat_338]|uniref:endonuclease V n=1 Tax=Chamaesiphon sp. VAR_69_metabat_338 TaxID=2964704 RepID=UPI00286E8362|nr:endonuclease V [Chamaesiphon sp. VAR_69_metabat_338]
MIFAVDVHYPDDKAFVAGILFQDWQDAAPFQQIATEIAHVAEYEPGQFYKRELPCILEILAQLESLPAIVIVDGYVYLGSDRKPGLGKYLYDALDGKAVIIGVAKNRFADTPTEAEVLRGNSQRPLYVTAIGIDLVAAKIAIERMAGEYRIPNLLKLVDKLSKSHDRT